MSIAKFYMRNNKYVTVGDIYRHVMPDATMLQVLHRYFFDRSYMRNYMINSDFQAAHCNLVLHTGNFFDVID